MLNSATRFWPSSSVKPSSSTYALKSRSSAARVTTISPQPARLTGRTHAAASAFKRDAPRNSQLERCALPRTRQGSTEIRGSLGGPAALIRSTSVAVGASTSSSHINQYAASDFKAAAAARDRAFGRHELTP